ncbi:uncharacterized protein LOC128220262 isoform X2 [Mya arenaria]|uniref:uncharacterized protein LOC128220262 isoform X2 n=1 Tax=Mya arenaria TaxID=6604 RepID=UPI0022E90340|nr:uncharacterized protein LOC128220262 isoform X2 [Mya arenaria]
MYTSRDIMSTNFFDIGFTQPDEFRDRPDGSSFHETSPKRLAEPDRGSSENTTPKQIRETDKPVKIANTQRDQFIIEAERDHPTPDPAVIIEPPEKEKEKTRCMGLKYALFVVMICVLLAGIIAVVVIFRNQDSLPVECPDVFVLVGERIKVTCNFTQNNNMISQWDFLKAAGDGGAEIATQSTYQPVTNKAKSKLLCSRGHDYIVTCDIADETRASCANQGEVKISFLDRGNYNFYTVSLSLNVDDKPINTVQLNPIMSGNQTSFNLTCGVEDVCKFYKMRFMANGNRVDGSTMKCLSSYSGQGGYSITCSDIVGGDKIREATNSLTCQTYDEAKPSLNTEEIVVQEEEFKFTPCCGLLENKHVLCDDIIHGSCDEHNNCTGICEFFTNCVNEKYINTDCDEKCGLPGLNTWCRGKNNKLVTDRSRPNDLCEAIVIDGNNGCT